MTVVFPPPEGADWIFELKYDGYRLQLATGAEGAPGALELYARWLLAPQR